MSHKNQHIIPKAYLKYFASDSKVHVVQLDNQYKRNVQLKGIGDKIFCDFKKGYYNFPNKNNEPYLEKMFGKVETKDYEEIMENIISKNDLGIETKNLIVKWMHMMKMRNSFLRDTFSGNIEWTEKTMLRLKTKSKISEEKSKAINLESIKSAKVIQLSTFLDNYQESLKDFFINFMFKDWTILKSDRINFLTSDNAGFSVSLSVENFSRGFKPVSSMYNLDKNVHVIHYFPLSNNYCLCLLPILKEIKEEEINSLADSKISFEEADEGKITLINKMTIQTSHKLVIGNKASDLENMNSFIESKFTP